MASPNGSDFVSIPDQDVQQSSITEIDGIDGANGAHEASQAETDGLNENNSLRLRIEEPESDESQLCQTIDKNVNSETLDPPEADRLGEQLNKLDKQRTCPENVSSLLKEQKRKMWETRRRNVERRNHYESWQFLKDMNSKLTLEKELINNKRRDLVEDKAQFQKMKTGLDVSRKQMMKEHRRMTEKVEEHQKVRRALAAETKNLEKMKREIEDEMKKLYEEKSKKEIETRETELEEGKSQRMDETEKEEQSCTEIEQEKRKYRKRLRIWKRRYAQLEDEKHHLEQELEMQKTNLNLTTLRAQP